jgi:hypothetical protein
MGEWLLSERDGLIVARHEVSRARVNPGLPGCQARSAWTPLPAYATLEEANL